MRTRVIKASPSTTFLRSDGGSESFNREEFGSVWLLPCINYLLEAVLNLYLLIPFYNWSTWYVHASQIQ